MKTLRREPCRILKKQLFKHQPILKVPTLIPVCCFQYERKGYPSLTLGSVYHAGIKLSLLLNGGLKLAVCSNQCDSFLLMWLGFFVVAVEMCLKKSGMPRIFNTFEKMCLMTWKLFILRCKSDLISLLCRVSFSSAEDYSSPQGERSPSLMVTPGPKCPLSAVPTSTQTKPHLLTPLSGREQPQARLKVARECPKSTKSCSSPPSTGRARLPQKQPLPLPSLSGAKQKRISRRRATNGWRAVGTPTEREVFIAVGYLSVLFVYLFIFA